MDIDDDPLGAWKGLCSAFLVVLVLFVIALLIGIALHGR